MAKTKYFAGDIELTNVGYRSNVLVGIDPSKPPVWDGTKYVGYVTVERKINYKSNPSRHECDARCYNATGRNMTCECSCGGKNHGRGALQCEAA